MSQMIETSQALDEAYKTVKQQFSSSDSKDIISYWLSVREDFHHLGNDLFDQLNRKVISENGSKINS